MIEIEIMTAKIDKEGEGEWKGKGGQKGEGIGDRL